MAIGFSDPRSGYSGTMLNDVYDGQRYYEQQERRYREEMDRQRMMAMQNTAYNPYTQMQNGQTDLQREQQAVQKAKTEADHRFTSNKKLLLLEN